MSTKVLTFNVITIKLLSVFNIVLKFLVYEMETGNFRFTLRKT